MKLNFPSLEFNSHGVLSFRYKVNYRLQLSKETEKILRYLVYILLFTAAIARSQTMHFNNEFYSPSSDSLLWKSPLKPQQVLSSSIKKLKIKQKQWTSSCKNCPDHPTKDMVKHHYSKSTIIYRYDAKGYPTQIKAKNANFPIASHRFTCRNYYNERGTLLQANLYAFKLFGKHKELVSSYKRWYNNVGQLLNSQVHSMYPKPLLMREHKFTYTLLGQISEFEDYWPVGNDIELYERKIFTYDSLGRMQSQQQVSKHEDAQKANYNNRTLFLYNRVGEESGYYRLSLKDTFMAAHRIALSASASATVLQTNYHLGSFRQATDSVFYSVEKIQNSKRYRWQYSYSKEQVAEQLLIVDLQTGLPLSIKNNYGSNAQQKCKVEQNYKQPEHLFSLDYFHRPNSVDYIYYKR